MRYLALALVAVLAIGATYSGMLDFGSQYVIASGRFGADVVHKFGYNPDLGLAAAADEDIWDCPELGANTTYPYPATAQTLYISSSHAGDTMEIVVSGVDANWGALDSIPVTLSGQTAVMVGSASNWLRPFRAQNLTSTALQGDVYLHLDSVPTAGVPDTPLTDILACIVLGVEQTRMTHYTIPDGFTGFMTHATTALSAANTGGVDVTLLSRLTTGVFRPATLWAATSGGTSIAGLPFDPPIMFPPKSDIKLRGDASANGMSLSGTFGVVLIRD